jgi:hypothetical protein
VPFLPDGCIPIFVPPDFRFGIVGIPHSTICVYGKDLLAAFEKSRPALFSTTMEWRRDPGPKGEA